MDNKNLENKASNDKTEVKSPKQIIADQEKEAKKKEKERLEAVALAKEAKEALALKVRTKRIKDGVLYIATDKYPGLEEGFELPINSKDTVKKFIKKGYIKHVKK